MLKEKKSVLRVPVFEQRVDNIVGIAYAMDLLDYVQKVGQFLLFLWL
jgi:CBS domain containing-hemolysin-like protein